MNRRQLLATGGTTLALTLAGCAGDTDDDNDREEGSTDDNGGANGDENGSADGGSTDAESSDQLVELLEHEWYNNGEYDSGVTGRLENVSGEQLSYVSVNVYFLDEEGTQIAEGLDNTNDLAADRVWEFDAMLLDGDASRVSDYEIETDVTNL